MGSMADKVAFILPEIALFVATCVVMVIGLSPKGELRRLCGPIAGAGLFLAGLLAINAPRDGGALLPGLMPYAKVLVAGVGLLLVMVLEGTVDRRREAEIEAGRARFDPLRSNRAEFFSFFLFSLTGLMLCASATDLIWLFLALELTSLPTYVMVTMSTRGTRSQEAGVKYFFLGALGAAIFLYGFALLYGGTGTTRFIEIAEVLRAQAEQGGMNPIAIAGLVLALVGIGFKIAAVPMHFYTADVYQGAASPVSAMLAFVPKAAGFIAILSLVGTVGWSWGVVDGQLVHGAGDALPPVFRVALWVIAVLTMTFGNVLALLQRSVKRVLAYSSIAHSGYMLVGVIAGPPGTVDGGLTENGLAAVLFYLLTYAVANIGAFAVVSMLERPGPDDQPEEADSFEALRGLCRTRPALGWTMVLSALSLLGMPPLIGFFGKLLLFTSGLAAGEYVLVVILGLNSAVAAFYYLRLVAAPLFEEPAGDPPSIAPVPSRTLAGLASAVGVIALAFTGDVLLGASERAARLEPPSRGEPARESRAGGSSEDAVSSRVEPPEAGEGAEHHAVVGDR